MSSIQFEKKETTMRVYSLFLPDDHNNSYACTEWCCSSYQGIWNDND